MVIKMVYWHIIQVMVALKTGIIKMFSLTREEQLMSFEAGPGPLLEADWSVGNRGMLIGAVCGQDWVMFDVAVSRWAKQCICFG